MRKPASSIVGAAALVIATAVGADAADLNRPSYTPQVIPERVAPAPYNWTGLYFGGNVGGMWASGTLRETVSGTEWSPSESGFAGGLQAGYNYQIGQVVWGLESTIDWGSLRFRSPPIVVPGGTVQATGSTSFVATLAGRVGYAVDNWLVYGKFGGAWLEGQSRVVNQTSGASAATSGTTSGLVYGGGIEYAFARNWTTRIEYDYISLDNRTATGPAGNIGLRNNGDVQLLTIGLNYKF